MIEQIKMAYRYLLVMGAGSVLLLLATLVPVLSTTADFSLYNTGWNGCSDLGRDVYSRGSLLPSIDISSSSEERVVHNTLSEMRDRLDPLRSAILIIGPRTEFSADEGRFAHDYLSSGGIILLADDFGSGDSLLSMLDTSTRISGSVMLDLAFMKEENYPVTNSISPTDITEGVRDIMMNNPSVVKPSPSALGLINSSVASWLDSDEDLKQDQDEESGPFTILSREYYGKGELLVLSDPSLMINQMKSKMDNGLLVKRIIDHLTSNRTTLLIDESHRDLTDPVRFMNDFVIGIEVPYKVTALMFLLVGFVVVQTPLPGKLISISRVWLDRLMKEPDPEPQTTELTISAVMRDHPDWNEKVLRQLIKDAEG